MKRHLHLLCLIVGVVLFAGLALQSVAEDHAYVGTNNCKKCHLKEYKSWSETKMAQSFEHLKPGVAADAKKAAGVDPDKDYTADPACLACHTVGYGKPGGFVDIATTPDRAGVGCEMCHGPGGSYTADDKMSLKNKEYKRADVIAAGLVYPVGEAQCLVCHNEKSPFFKEFDYAARKDEGTHENYPLKYNHD